MVMTNQKSMIYPQKRKRNPNIKLKILIKTLNKRIK